MARRSPFGEWWLTHVLQPVRCWGMIAVLETIRILPLRPVTAGFSALGRLLGPLSGTSAIAHKNLARAYPGMDRALRGRIVTQMWDSLSRTTCEYAHLKEIFDDAANRVEIVGLEHLEALRDDGKPGIVFSAHLSSWEMVTLTARARGLPVHVVYRNANNLRLDEYVRKMQGVTGASLIRKSLRGARELMQVMQAGGHVVMLADQKLNEGIAVPFFGHQAMTAPALAQLALRFDCPVVPAHVERLPDARFRVTFDAPLALPQSGDRNADILALMTEVNRRIETWIRARPGDWLWLHRRWPKEDVLRQAQDEEEKRTSSSS